LSTQRLIIGITGATGIVSGIRPLETLRRIGIETHLVVSHAADMTRAYETRRSPTPKDLRNLADVSYSITDVAWSCWSGRLPSRSHISGRCFH
jgi:4-hydroxy-3-polyprenylbenzoate decarboxylase